MPFIKYIIVILFLNSLAYSNSLCPCPIDIFTLNPHVIVSDSSKQIMQSIENCFQCRENLNIYENYCLLYSQLSLYHSNSLKNPMVLSSLKDKCNDYLDELDFDIDEIKLLDLYRKAQSFNPYIFSKPNTPKKLRTLSFILIPVGIVSLIGSIRAYNYYNYEFESDTMILGGIFGEFYSYLGIFLGIACECAGITLLIISKKKQKEYDQYQNEKKRILDNSFNNINFRLFNFSIPSTFNRR